MDHVSEVSPGPSAEIPLLHGERKELAWILKQGASYYQISLLGSRLVQHVENLPDFLKSGRKHTAECLADLDRAPSMAWQVFHAIPRGMLESLVLGTVAYDFKRPHGRHETYQDDDSLGVYAIGMCVTGRDGAWLTANELEKIVEDLEAYILGYEIYGSCNGNPPQSQSDKDLLDFVHDVDNQISDLGGWDHSRGPKYITKDEHVRDFRLLAASFRKRCLRSRYHDGSGKTPMIQTPLYVGCSKNMKKMWWGRHTSATSVSETNKAMSLTVSLMNRRGYECELVKKPVVRLWDNDQLSVGEALAAALSNCYISQDGFNLTEAGGQNGRAATADLIKAKGYVHGVQPFLYENLKLSCEDMESRAAFVKEFQKFRPLLDDEEYSKLEAMEPLVEKLRQSGLQIRQLMISVNNKIERMEAKLAALEKGLHVHGSW